MIEIITRNYKTIFGYFDRCFLANQVLAKYNFFLKIFWNKRYVQVSSKKKVEGKSQVTRNLSSCVIETFNGYEIIRHYLARHEKKEFVPIDIIYEPIFNEKIPIHCFFTDQVHVAYRNYIGRIDKGKEHISHRVVKQC